MIPPDMALGIISGAGRSPAAPASAYLMRPHAHHLTACGGSPDHSCFALGTVPERRRRRRRRWKREGEGGGQPDWIPRFLLLHSLSLSLLDHLHLRNQERYPQRGSQEGQRGNFLQKRERGEGGKGVWGGGGVKESNAPLTTANTSGISRLVRGKKVRQMKVEAKRVPVFALAAGLEVAGDGGREKKRKK